MLVLSRKLDEVIVIGKPPHETRITVVAIHGNVVRLGIDAADDDEIVRGEKLNEWVGRGVARAIKGDGA